MPVCNLKNGNWNLLRMIKAPKLRDNIAKSILGSCTALPASIPALVTLAVSYGYGIFCNTIAQFGRPSPFRYASHRPI